MVQIIEQTHEEKLEMYMKLTKEEIVALLLENQRLLAVLAPAPVVYQPYVYQAWDVTPAPYTPYRVTCSIK